MGVIVREFIEERYGVLARLEERNRFRLDRYALARLRIPALSRVSFLDLETAETPYFHLAALGEGFDYVVEYRRDYDLHVFFREDRRLPGYRLDEFASCHKKNLPLPA